MSGGIKAWQNEIAVGPEDLGLSLFTGSESIEETITVAYGLEQGLRDFYLSMTNQVKGETAQKLFTRLADIEIIHQNHLIELYQQLTGTTRTREDFDKDMNDEAMEGGLTTEDYLSLYQPDLESTLEIVSLAMSIEAQALDLYQRTADRAGDETTRKALHQIASDERAHLSQLAGLIDSMQLGEK